MLTILDGPMGTELAARGLDTPLPQWSAQALVDAPQVVAAIHRDYAAAGANMHTANTFRTQPRKRPGDWGTLARRAVVIARASVPRGHRIAASIAPLEDCYRPDLSPLDPRNEFRELALLLASTGIVDVLLCESFANVREASVACEEAARTGIETWASLTAGPDGDLLTPGALGEAARVCRASGARAVLVNCVAASRTRAYVEALAKVGPPFGAYANAGAESERIGWRRDEGRGPEAYAAFARDWITAGATIIGSCCGTGPEHIGAVARLAAEMSAED